MTKKLFVPEHVAKAAATAIKGSSEIPKPIENAFGKVAKNKNSDDPSDIKQSALERLPQPTGYRILIIPYYPSEKTKGGIIVPDAVRERESFATVSAYVVKLGPDAYKDAQKFPSGSYANEKDWVLIGRYSGNRFKVEGLEVRIINDDNIIATILDPKDISYV
jgi:co-chaperonin GroES (HSP10)|tara:strand:- start:1086 stop:1574 length:489 start_codon:yes stop_codon:yes gene_type:complete